MEKACVAALEAMGEAGTAAVAHGIQRADSDPSSGQVLRPPGGGAALVTWLALLRCVHTKSRTVYVEFAPGVAVVL